MAGKSSFRLGDASGIKPDPGGETYKSFDHSLEASGIGPDQRFNLSVNDVAAFFGVSPAVVRREARELRLEGRKFGGQWRFTLGAVSTYLANQMAKVRGKT